MDAFSRLSLFLLLALHGILVTRFDTRLFLIGVEPVSSDAMFLSPVIVLIHDLHECILSCLSLG